jgi:hypothetical protein
MPIKKRTVVLDTTDTSKSLSLGGRYGIVRKIKVLSEGTTPDTSVNVTIVDSEGESVWDDQGTKDYSTAVTAYLVAANAVTQANAAATNAVPVVVRGPLTVAVANLAVGAPDDNTITVDVYVETTVSA